MLDITDLVIANDYRIPATGISVEYHKNGVVFQCHIPARIHIMDFAVRIGFLLTNGTPMHKALQWLYALDDDKDFPLPEHVTLCFDDDGYLIDIIETQKEVGEVIKVNFGDDDE